MTGLVIKSTGNLFLVELPGGPVIPCGIKGKFRIRGIRATNPVAVGDRVRLEWDGSDAPGIIVGIEERKNYIIRKASNLSREYQLLASNVDAAWLMVSLVMPRTLTAFMDRFLVSSEAYRIPAVILFNKIDLDGRAEMEELEALERVYSRAGYPCRRLSLKLGNGLEEVRRDMAGKVIVVAGNSGVGKSTLISTLDPAIQLRTEEVSESNQSGRHTTTFSQMYHLKGDIRVIDTPGIRGFGTIDIRREELFHFFPEIFRASAGCRYHNCLHLNEPGCAVKSAVEDGSISESRYLNYLLLLEEEEAKYR
ncbi:MAG: ribosome small subunit-dependent GTPase A [Bacteroidales bacterium]